MSFDRQAQALTEIADNIALALSFVDGMDQARFHNDSKTQYAVIRCLEIISEASRKLDAAFKAEHPGIPCKAIAGSGNIYRHNYENVSPEMIWNTVRDSLPPLWLVAKGQD